MKKPIVPGQSGNAQQRGVALIEAAIALVLVSSGLLAYLGINAQIAGVSAQNRTSSFTLLASQAAQEMLRNRDFATIAASGSGTIQYSTSTLAGSASTTVRYCWTASPIVVPAVSTTNLLRLTTTAVLAGSNCDTTDANNPARIQALLARSNPKASARNAPESTAADGDGQLVNNYTPPPNSTTAPAPGGFNYVRDPDGRLLAVTSPTNPRVALVPKPGSNAPLKIATINGNVVLDHAATAAQFNAYRIFAEGHALCNKFHPNLPANPPPTITANGQTISVFQYSCVVPDGWRRAIAIAPPDTQKKVCTGWPDLQPDASTSDELVSVGRQYFGNKFTNPPSDLTPVRSGMRGSATPSQSQIGTICTAADPCWAKPDLRPWIPGGHHYFIIDTSANSAPPLCATRMEDVFTSIDFSNGTAAGTRVSNYGGILFRNTHRTYCANTKDYTNSIYSQIIPGTTTQECISSTRMDGFIVPNEGVSVPLSTMELTSNSDFDGPCAIIGPFGTQGGAYSCSFKDLPSSGQVDVRPRNGSLVFSPNGYGPLNPLNFMHDITGNSFTVANSAAPAPASCAAGTVNWTAGSNSCSGSIASGALNSTQNISNAAAGLTGSATYVCNSAGWTISGTPTCSPSTPSPASCPAGTVNWSVAGNNCSASLASGTTGNAQTVTNSAPNASGSATFTCQSTGIWNLNAGSTCSAAAVQACPTATITGTSHQNSTVTANSGFSCTRPTNTTFSCTASNVPSNTSVTVTRAGPGNQSNSRTTNIVAGACTVSGFNL